MKNKIIKQLKQYGVNQPETMFDILYRHYLYDKINSHTYSYMYSENELQTLRNMFQVMVREERLSELGI